MDKIWAILTPAPEEFLSHPFPSRVGLKHFKCSENTLFAEQNKQVQHN